MKVVTDEKAGTITITVAYNAKGRQGKGETWPLVHATETANPEVNGETKRIQVTVLGK